MCIRDSLQIACRQPLLFHPEFDGLDRVRRAERVVLVLVGFDQGHEHVPLVGFRCALVSLKEALESMENGAQVCIGADGPNSH